MRGRQKKGLEKGEENQMRDDGDYRKRATRGER